MGGGGRPWAPRDAGAIRTLVSIELFGVSMTPRSSYYSSRPRQGLDSLTERNLTNDRGEYQTHTFHLVLSMGSIK